MHGNITSVSFVNMSEASQKRRMNADVQESYWALGKGECMEQRSIKGRIGRKV